MTNSQRMVKRVFDLVIATFGVVIVSPIIFVGWIAAALSTGANGFFVHRRVGMHGKLIPVLKLRTMREVEGVTTTVTAQNDVRITPIGSILRRSKIDELPQLLNVIAGHMSLVGPRPDMQEFADALEGDERIVLSIRPGITGPATLAYRKEEQILAEVDDPIAYNHDVIWPEKVKLNCEYIKNYSLSKDIFYIWQTVIG